MNYRTALFRFYKDKVFPEVNSLRGATKALGLLQSFAELGLEKVSEKDAESIFDRDWQNLIILDGTRFDLYEQCRSKTDSRITLGSCSREFIRKTFSNRNYSDVVYITANPHFHESVFKELTGKHPEDVFYEVFHTYETDWDYEKNTVLPSSVIDDFRVARRLFPEKRIVLHFMQPHYPFLDSEINRGGIRPDLNHDKEEKSVWELAESREIELDRLWKDYRRNLEIVLESLEKLDFDRKTVVTADHGNLVGENDLYGHPCNSSASLLRKVPWEVIHEE